MNKYEYDCPDCSQTFKNQEEFIEHFKTHLNNYKRPLFSDFVFKNNPKEIIIDDNKWYRIKYKNINFYLENRDIDMNQDDFDFAIKYFKKIKGLNEIGFELKEVWDLQRRNMVESEGWSVASRIKFDTKYKKNIEFWLHSASQEDLMLDALIEGSDNNFIYDSSKDIVYLNLK